MAMKKAEMEQHRAEYHSLMSMARLAESRGLYREAVEHALESWDHVDGMMQYERRYEKKQFKSIHGTEMILKYAPLLLDYPSLDRLEALLKSSRRIDNNTTVNISKKLAKARSLMWGIHRFWDYLEHHPEALQSKLAKALGGDQIQWRTVAEEWERMGLLHRSQDNGSYRLHLTTRTNAIVSAKCPSCASTAEAPKAMFFQKMPCPECHEAVFFVILPTGALLDTKE